MNKYNILLLLGVWIGIVIGLSFIGAPLKFQAPGITTKLGVGIGNIVFNFLNKLEVVFVALLLMLLFFKGKQTTAITMLAIGVTSIVLFQLMVLLPDLNERVINVLEGRPIKDSYHHTLYVVCEILKVSFLFLLFFSITKT